MYLGTYCGQFRLIHCSFPYNRNSSSIFTYSVTDLVSKYNRITLTFVRASEKIDEQKKILFEVSNCFLPVTQIVLHIQSYY